MRRRKAKLLNHPHSTVKNWPGYFVTIHTRVSLAFGGYFLVTSSGDVTKRVTCFNVLYKPPPAAEQVYQRNQET